MITPERLQELIYICQKGIDESEFHGDYNNDRDYEDLEIYKELLWRKELTERSMKKLKKRISRQYE